MNLLVFKNLTSVFIKTLQISVPSRLNVPDGGDQIGADAAFVDTSICACRNGAGQQLARIILAHYQNYRLLRVLPEMPGDLEPVHSRHAYIEQNHVRMEFSRLLNSFGPVSRFPANLPASLRRYQLLHAAADEFIVVNDKDSHSGWNFPFKD